MTRLLSSARDRRAARLGLFAIAGILLLGRGLPALRRAESEWRVRAEAQRLALDAANRARAAAEEMDSDPRAAVSRAEAAFAAESPTAAAASAVAYLSDLCRGLDVALHAVRPAGDSAFRDGVARVTVHLSLSANTSGARALLDQLEWGPKLFRVSALDVAQPAPAAPPGIEESLRIELTVQTLAWRVSEEVRG